MALGHWHAKFFEVLFDFPICRCARVARLRIAHVRRVWFRRRFNQLFLAWSVLSAPEVIAHDYADDAGAFDSFREVPRAREILARHRRYQTASADISRGHPAPGQGENPL